MKKLITTIFTVMVILAAIQSSNAQSMETRTVVPYKKFEGHWMPSVNLPAVDIVANKNIQTHGYELPEVVIITSKNLSGLFPATHWNGEYIASVNLKQVDIMATRKKVSLASVFSFDWLFKK